MKVWIVSLDDFALIYGIVRHHRDLDNEIRGDELFEVDQDGDRVFFNAALRRGHRKVLELIRGEN